VSWAPRGSQPTIQASAVDVDCKTTENYCVEDILNKANRRPIGKDQCL
jgi:hypothetical protein